MASTNARLSAALTSFQSDVIDLDVAMLGTQIMRLIKDVGQLEVVTVADLRVFGESETKLPKDVTEAIKWGTKFFDAIYYFALESSLRPGITTGAIIGGDVNAAVMLTKKRLLWTAIFLMLRGSYPESTGMTTGSDIPAFLVNICGMNESPSDCAAGLASFNLGSISPLWIREIKWAQFAAPIRQRLGLGLAGYRALTPFKMYECKESASAEAKAAFEWVRRITQAPADYAILSCTRDAALISKLGSWNAALGNLSLECFSREDLAEMESVRILFQIPTRDPRADTWRAWVSGGDLQLNDPIGLN
jgi:hypothetical protein